MWQGDARRPILLYVAGATLAVGPNISTVRGLADLSAARPPEHPPLVAIGVDHRQQEWCARLALTDASLHKLLASLAADPWIAEAAALVTCNRVELYAVPGTAAQATASAPPLPAVDRLTTVLLNTAGLEADAQPPLSHYDGTRVADHLARVACGLESMLFGETEILGQVAGAAESAQQAGSLGPTLRLLFQHAVSAGKRARTQTAVSRHALSVSALAVNHAESLVPDLTTTTIAVIGTGLAARLVLGALKTRNAAQVTVVSRDLERARHEADSWGADAAAFDDLDTVLTGTRVAFCATDGHGVIGADLIADVVARRAERKSDSDRDGDAQLLLVDIAAPRNVAAGVAALPGVAVRGMADLGGESERALALRRKEVPQVEAIVAAERGAFLAALRELRAHPVIAALRTRAEQVRQRELQRSLDEVQRSQQQVGGDANSDAVRRQLDKLSRSIVNQLLHQPTVRLRAAAENGSWDEHDRVVRHLFELDPQPEPDPTE